MFTHIAFLFISYCPLVYDNILKIYSRTWIRLIASHNDRKKQTIIDLHILKANVSNIDEWLRCASSFWIIWVEHTSRSTSTRLFLLLRAQVNCPPYRSFQIHVLINDIYYFTTAFISRIGFQIKSLQRISKVGIFEIYVSNTIMTHIWRNTANRQPYTQFNGNILNQHILCTINKAPFMTWFGHYYVIEILNSKVVDMEMPSSRIYSICIQWKSWQNSFNRKLLHQIELSSCVDLYIQVIDINVLT